MAGSHAVPKSRRAASPVARHHRRPGLPGGAGVQASRGAGVQVFPAAAANT